MYDVLIRQADLRVFFLGKDLREQLEKSGGVIDERSKGEGAKTVSDRQHPGPTHQHYDAFVQRAGCLEGLLPAVDGILPLQTAFDEGLGLGVFTFCVQYEVPGDLILHSCWKEEQMYTSFQFSFSKRSGKSSQMFDSLDSCNSSVSCAHSSSDE